MEEIGGIHSAAPNCQDIEDSFKCPECGAPEFLVLKPAQPDSFNGKANRKSIARCKDIDDER